MTKIKELENKLAEAEEENKVFFDLSLVPEK